MRNKESIIVFLGVFWLFGIYYFYSKMSHQALEKPVMTTVEILFAKKNIIAGKDIQINDLEWQTVDENQVTSDYIKNKGQLLSSYVNRSLMISLKPGEAIKESYFTVVVTGKKFSKNIAQNKFAITIDVSASSSKFITPDDKIDVFLTYNSVEQNKKTTAIRILSNIHVLAVGDKTDNSSSIGSSNLNSSNSPAPSSVTTPLTLEVNSKQASVLSLAKSLGTLSIAIQSGFTPKLENQILSPDNKVDPNSLESITPPTNQPHTIIEYHGSQLKSS